MEGVLRKIDDPKKKKFVEIVMDLEVARREYTKTKHVKRQSKKFEMTVDRLKNYSLDTCDKNRIMTLILESNGRYKVRKNTKYRIFDVILYVLFAQPSQPIHGRIAITKQVFLTIKREC